VRRGAVKSIVRHEIGTDVECFETIGKTVFNSEVIGE
jgi:hypothetical protein